MDVDCLLTGLVQWEADSENIQNIDIPRIHKSRDVKTEKQFRGMLIKNWVLLFFGKSTNIDFDGLSFVWILSTAY